MADRCNYPSEIDMDGRMFGGEHKGRTLGFAPTLPPNVGANLVFAHYARKLRLHRAMLYALRRSTRNPIRANIDIYRRFFRWKCKITPLKV
uniref:Uncharacterized protein n=1 Tax=Candidatus Kentrum sp. FM TaxID=2126340 RepID=A0A450WBS2_9GAMM|nr:MAG: hypothetical protein BECKFM1743C_GA0114222_103144 [Candidatus Kentron sp. FM]VFK14499.1 MAG: hypothetical protein BECKFM1743B_GA0114221_103243 [Candidatus Kentron sp. FM]